jgi:putative oxygen-independent coproporphyrinogen III oxidase
MSDLALYIHWPFCKSKCPYCDFNSHVRDGIEEGRWRRALLAELDHAAAAAPGRRVSSIFFGGGTPSLMAPATVAALLDCAASRWMLADDVEITLEANPTSVEAARFAALRQAGVNRVSLGVQALEDQALRFLGRGHSAGEAIAAIGLARQHFPRYSFDLIYARPGQALRDWTEELARAVALAGDHLSVYQLTIEAGTAFATAAARGDWQLPDDAIGGDLFEATQEILGAAGLPAYEISNHARPGAECRHNLAYWRYADYVGIGPGAHGRMTEGAQKLATRRFRAPKTWLAAVERKGDGIEESVPLSPEERREEMLMMGLRLARGIERADFRRETGEDIAEAIDRARLADLVEGGFLTLDPNALSATAAGRQRLNAVLARLIA